MGYKFNGVLCGYRKDESLTFDVLWLESESITLSKASQENRNKIISYFDTKSQRQQKWTWYTELSFEENGGWESSLGHWWKEAATLVL